MNNDTHVKAAIRTVPIDRAIPNGFDLIDYLRLTKAVDAGEDYAGTCFEFGDENRMRAEKALERGHSETAKQFFLNAVAAYRVGQYTIIPDNEIKKAAYRKLIDCYAEAAKLFEPEIERVSIPYKKSNMEGWLRMPRDADRKIPIVISVGGADGWREEHHNYSQFYVDRGIAYLMIDGPGQGETRLFNGLYMETDNERALNAVIDRMHDDPRFEGIGMIGYSFGGYLVARAAAISDKLDACIVNGGSYRPSEILDFLPHFTHVFSALSGKRGDELEDFINGMTMEGFASGISCPLLLNHGKPDPLFSWEGIQRIYDESVSRSKDIRIWDDGNHCVTNHSTEVITMFADWFHDVFARGGGRG